MKTLALFLLAALLAGCQTAEYRPASATEAPLPASWQPGFERLPLYVRSGEARPGMDHLYTPDGKGGYRRTVWLVGVRY